MVVFGFVRNLSELFLYHMKFTLLYSKKENEKQTVYLRHRYSVKGKPTEVKIGTNFEIKKEHWDPKNECWDLSFKVNAARKPEHKILNSKIDDFNTGLGNLKRKLSDFLKENKYPTYEQFHSIIFGEVKPQKKETGFPEKFSDFIDFYIKEKSVLIPGKQKPISKASENRYIQIKTRLNKFYPGLKVTEVDDDFRDKFSIFMNKLKYKSSYIVKELKFIKTFCKYASKKLDVSKEVLLWSFVDTDSHSDKYDDPIFTFKEIEAIKNVNLESDRLDNVRDWLLISCYTGQRISDLLSMSSDNIVNLEFYQVFQQKGQKGITIYLMPEVLEILKKRNGEFPRKISNQKYNDYIKIVCQKAKIENVIKGGKEIEKRKVIDFYPKWELVTSHIGRRTFVSLFESILGKELVKVQTGHTTDAMINLYNKTEAIDKAKKVKEVYQNHFNKPE